jgi:hypothetical protein
MPPVLAHGPTRKRRHCRPAEHGQTVGAESHRAQTRSLDGRNPPARRGGLRRGGLRIQRGKQRLLVPGHVRARKARPRRAHRLSSAACGRRGATLAGIGHRYSLLRIQMRANQPAMGGR